MNSNVGLMDRVIRLVIAVLMFSAYYFEWVFGWIAFTSVIIGAAMTVTAIMGDCYMYRILNINTKKT